MAAGLAFCGGQSSASEEESLANSLTTASIFRGREDRISVICTIDTTLLFAFLTLSRMGYHI